MRRRFISYLINADVFHWKYSSDTGHRWISNPHNIHKLYISSISSSSRTAPSARSNANRVEFFQGICSIEIFEFESSKGVCSIELDNFELRAGKTCSMLDSNSTRLDSKAISGEEYPWGMDFQGAQYLMSQEHKLK